MGFYRPNDSSITGRCIIVKSILIIVYFIVHFRLMEYFC